METDDGTTDSGASGGEKTFTRAEVRAMIAAEVKKVREQFGDYDELKQQAAAAAGDVSKIDKLTQAVEALTKRAETAELDVARRAIADEFGLNPKEARRLRGKSVDELRSDAEEFVEDMGIDVKARKAGGNAGRPAAGADAGNEGESGNGDDGQQQGGSDDAADAGRRTAPARRGTPRETLRSGVAGSANGEPDLEKLDPLELIKGVPRR